MSDMNVARECRKMRLECVLTEHELLERARAMAEKAAEAHKLEDERAAQAKRLKRQIDGLQHEMDDLAEKVRSGKEEREVDVQDEYRWLTGEVVTRRTDTWDVVARRQMSDRDRQLRWDLEETAVDQAARKLVEDAEATGTGLSMTTMDGEEVELVAPADGDAQTTKPEASEEDAAPARPLRAVGGGEASDV